MSDEYVITWTVTSEIVVDPPDMEPGWYVDIYTQMDKQERRGMRYGPIDFAQLETAKADLLHYETGVFEKSIEYLKRSITERIHGSTGNGTQADNTTQAL